MKGTQYKPFYEEQYAARNRHAKQLMCSLPFRPGFNSPISGHWM